MRTETAQRVLWFAMIFIILGIIATVVAGFGVLVAFTLIDLGSFISDPTLLTFIKNYPLAIPVVIWILAGLEIIYLGIIYTWRKDPMRHRTGFTIVGILNLLVGFSLPGLFIILPGLLLED